VLKCLKSSIVSSLVRSIVYRRNDMTKIATALLVLVTLSIAMPVRGNRVEVTETLDLNQLSLPLDRIAIFQDGEQVGLSDILNKEIVEVTYHGADLDPVKMFVHTPDGVYEIVTVVFF
jgi:hypothetical protein